jgi:hypothetical protein
MDPTSLPSETTAPPQAQADAAAAPPSAPARRRASRAGAVPAPEPAQAAVSKARRKAAPVLEVAAVRKRPYNAAPKAGPGTTAKAAPKSAPKSTAKAAPKAKPKAPAGAAAPKPVKSKAKLVRDSFTMPQADFDLIAKLKARTLAFARPTKKSELLRAGLAALQALDDPHLELALAALVPLKPGRPRQGG